MTHRKPVYPLSPEDVAIKTRVIAMLTREPAPEVVAADAKPEAGEALTFDKFNCIRHDMKNLPLGFAPNCIRQEDPKK